MYLNKCRGDAVCECAISDRTTSVAMLSTQYKQLRSQVALNFSFLVLISGVQAEK